MNPEPLSELERVLVGLRDATRRRILASFYTDERERTIDEVADEVAVHRTVAFQHLERLASAGFLATGQRRGRPGEPAKTYSLLAGPVVASLPPRRFGELAHLLGSALVRVRPQGSHAVHVIGRAYGRDLAAGTRGTDDAMGRLSQAFGATYRFEGGAVRAVPCVFREPCSSARAVVCALHTAIIEGVMDAASAPCAATPLGPGAGGCGYSIKRKRN